MTRDAKMTTTMSIDGMKCHNCTGRVEKAVSLLTGVDRVTVDLATRTATLTYDTAQINRSSIVAAIENLGHGYQVVDK